MPRRRQRPVTGTSARIPTTERSDATSARGSGKPSVITRWHGEVRPKILRSAVAATESLRWSCAAQLRADGLDVSVGVLGELSNSKLQTSMALSFDAIFFDCC
jgi:hypothetical protein